MKKLIFSTLLVVFLSVSQQDVIPEWHVCYAGEYLGFSKISRQIPPQKSLRQFKSSDIEVSYVDFPDAAKVAFEAAVEIWETYLVSSQKIRIKASWDGSLPNGTLAQSKSTRILNNFSNSVYRDVWYVLPLAEALAGREFNNGTEDIEIVMNKNLPWSFNSQNPEPGRNYDLTSIALHEIAHGLGFATSFNLLNSNQAKWGQNGLPYIYDLFVTDKDLNALADAGRIGNPSNELKELISNSAVLFNTETPLSGNGFPKLYAPNPYENGASISHLDEKEYPNGSSNSLMTPIISPGEVILDPGIYAFTMLQEMGWTIRNLDPLTPLSLEGTQKLDFKVFPNPCSVFCTVYLPQALMGKNVSLQLVNLSGKIISQKDFPHFNGENIRLNTTGVPSGLYLLNVLTDQHHLSQRLLISGI